jgi:hypothetical protein
LTKDLIADDNWEKVKFKKYNYQTLGKEVNNGALHPLLRVRTQFREILLELENQELTAELKQLELQTKIHQQKRQQYLLKESLLTAAQVEQEKLADTQHKHRKILQEVDYLTIRAPISGYVIAEDLKMKSSDYMCENQNYFLSNENVEDNEPQKEEYFLLEVKLNDDVFISRIFPAHVYHPKARYAVDVRPKVRKILSELTDVLSDYELETTYLGYEL